jgi:hypothetical protein
VVTHDPTGLAISLVTNESGRYIAPSLKPGAYTISAAVPGFKTYVQSGITLQVNQSARSDRSPKRSASSPRRRS